MKPFFLPAVLAVDIYAYLDGIARFPSIPSIESYFAFKLMGSVIAKTIIYATGFANIQAWSLLFLSALFLNVWLLPVLYVMALPFGDSSPGLRKDRDMLIEVLYFLTDEQEREEKILAFKTSWMSFKKQFISLGDSIPTELATNEKAYI